MMKHIDSDVLALWTNATMGLRCAALFSLSLRMVIMEFAPMLLIGELTFPIGDMTQSRQGHEWL
jgi:hypothetical protein